MFEVLADASAQPAGADSMMWYLVTAAATGLIGAGGALLKLGSSAGKFLAPLIQKVTDAHVSFLHKIEVTSEAQVDATKTLATVVDAMRAENGSRLQAIEEIHRHVVGNGNTNK